MWTPKELKAVYPLHRCLVDGDGCVFSALSPEIHHQLLGLVDVEWEVVLLTPFSQGTHLRSVGRLIVVSDQAYHRCVVSEFDDDVGAVCGCTVMCVQGVQWVGWGRSPEEHQCWGSTEMKCCPFWPPDFCLSESPGSSCTEICLVLESGASQPVWQALWYGMRSCSPQTAFSHRRSCFTGGREQYAGWRQ